MDGTRSRSLAQAETLRSLARVFPAPLIELRQIARPLGAGPEFGAQLDAWAAKWHLEELREVAEAHVYYWAGTPAAADQFLLLTPPSVLPLVRFGHRPPTVIDVEWSPSVVWQPLEQLDPFNPRDPLVFHPDYESEADFRERVTAHCRERTKSEITTPAHRRSALAQHAEWYVLRVVARPRQTLAALARGGDISTVTKAIGRFRKLLRAGL